MNTKWIKWKTIHIIQHMLKHRKIYLLGLLGIFIASCLIGLSRPSIANTGWKMPWPSSVRSTITQRLHTDGWNRQAFDIGLPAGTPVLAPVDSTLVRQCIARNTNNHRAIRLRDPNGREYSLIHVTANNVRQSYRQGEQIGVVAPETRVNDPSCAISYGVHLHFGLPQVPFTVDGHTFSGSTSTGTRLVSTNHGAIPRVAQVINRATNRALDGGGANGGQVYMHPDPRVGGGFQRWRFNQVGSFYMIINEASGRALDGGGANGGQVYPHPSPNPSNNFQLWRLG